MLKKLFNRARSTTLALSRQPSVLTRAIELDPYNIRPMIRKLNAEGRDPTRLLQATALTGLIAQMPPRYEMSLTSLYSRAKGQLLQDVLAAALIGDGSEGYFVEVGVGDGVSLSNTYLLETELGWNGLLIEPNRHSHANIAANRSAALSKKAAYGQSGMQLEFLSVSGFHELSSLQAHAKTDLHERDGSVYHVETVSLDEALTEVDAPKTISFMSIDTEGSELEVLAGLDLDIWTVRLFAIEHNFRAGYAERIMAKLRPYGYRQILPGVSQFDIWIAHESVSF